MKWIFFTLLLANVAFAAYLYQSESGHSPIGQQGIQSPVSDAPLIQLLSEKTGRSVREIEVEQVLANPIVEVAGVTDDNSIEKECQSLGPFEDLVAAQDIAERLNAVGVAVNLRAVDEETGEFDFRVVLPPLSSLQEAFRRLRELKSRDIDSYVISQGDDAQGISLGVFSTIEAAESHQANLAADGYETVIREIPRLYRGYWVFADRGVAFPEDQVTEFTGSTVGVRESSCLN